MSEEPPLRFNNEQKIRRQMRNRGWTENEIREALMTTPIPCRGKHNFAVRYVHPVSGKSVIVDVATKEIFHVGGEGYLYES